MTQNQWDRSSLCPYQIECWEISDRDEWFHLNGETTDSNQLSESQEKNEEGESEEELDLEKEEEEEEEEEEGEERFVGMKIVLPFLWRYPMQLSIANWTAIQ